MSTGRRYITLNGTAEVDALGIFTVIRGFADLKDLAEISVAYELADVAEGGAEGHQRKLVESHRDDIRRYLERSDYRFLPEVILSLRVACRRVEEAGIAIGVETEGDGPVRVRRRWKGKNHRDEEIRVDLSEIETVRSERLFRRIDGNHRLAAAEAAAVDETRPTQYVAPFSIIVLGPTGDAADDYAESLVFHTLNSTALPLESEHALTLVLSQPPDQELSADQEFQYSPVVYFTRLLRQRLESLPKQTQERLGERPLTALAAVARALIELQPEVALSIEALRKYVDDIFAGLVELLPLVALRRPEFAKTPYAIDMTARIWMSADAPSHDERVAAAFDRLDEVARWVKEHELANLNVDSPLSEQLLTIFDRVKSTIPSKVFLARWYPSKSKEGEQHTRSVRRFQQIKETIRDLNGRSSAQLVVVDMGTTTGGTEMIHPEMYRAIEEAQIIIIDLTGLRPNVCVEAGYALKHHLSGRLLFLFEPTALAEKVPFDLTPFRYIEISQAADIPPELTPNLETILTASGATVKPATP